MHVFILRYNATTTLNTKFADQTVQLTTTAFYRTPHFGLPITLNSSHTMPHSLLLLYYTSIYLLLIICNHNSQAQPNAALELRLELSALY